MKKLALLASAALMLFPMATSAATFMYRGQAGVITVESEAPAPPVGGQTISLAAASFKLSLNQQFGFDLRNLLKTDNVDPDAVTFAVQSGGPAPSWLSIDSAGVLTGTPDQEGTVAIDVMARTDDGRSSLVKRYSFEVFDALLAEKVVAGGRTTCAITLSNGAKCWVWGREGQLGNGNGANLSTLPVRVEGLEGRVRDLAIGHSSVVTVCALLDDRSVSCWGANPGNGSASSRVPVAVPGLTEVVSIAAGNSHVCAAKTDGSVWCWGDNSLGQRGEASLTNVRSPVRANLVSAPISKLVAGAAFTCGLTGAGDAYCWGNNGSGQLGNGTSSYNLDTMKVDPSPTATAVVGLGSGAKKIAASYSHACAIRADDKMACWGSGMVGELGTGVIDSSNKGTLKAVTVVGRVDDIAIGSQYSCSMTGGAVQCWGWGRLGRSGSGLNAPWEWPHSTFPIPDIQIENGYITPSTDPYSTTALPVVGMQSGVVEISASEVGGCGLMADHRVKCWGESYPGRIGDGLDTDKWSPVYVHAGQP